MSNRDGFIKFTRPLREISSTITKEQRIGLLRRAVKQYGLDIDEADNILKDLQLVVGEEINYFEVLGLSIAETENQSEADIAASVQAAHKKHYSASLRAGGRPRPDGRTQDQWRTILNQARDTLKDTQKRRKHIAVIQYDEDELSLAGNVSLHNEDNTPLERNTAFPNSNEITGRKFRHQDAAYHADAPTDMVLIPAGEFQMGSNDGNDDEKPVDTAYVGAFYMDKYLVTNKQFKVFLYENQQWRVRLGVRFTDTCYSFEKSDHPVTGISWYLAMAYAQWDGKRLPTETEWEKAARGGLVGKKYPWGDSVYLSKANYFPNVSGTTPVDRYPANGYGLYDMSGNVWEWCLDVYDENFYDRLSNRNPFAGPHTVEWVTNNFKKKLRSIIESPHVLRGGSWLTAPQDVRVAYRFVENLTDRGASLASHNPTFGFRCVRSVTS